MVKVKNRNLFLFILLNTVTCGIYGIVAFCIMGNEINETCEGDGKKTMFYLWAFLLGIITLGIVPLIWFYKAMERLNDNGYRYGITVKHSGNEFILWYLLGSLIVVGPLVAVCYFVSDVNQFSDYVGKIQPKRYSADSIERKKIEREEFPFEPETSDPVQKIGEEIPGTTVEHNVGKIMWISGDYNGYTFPVNPGKEIIIGKDPSVANIVVDLKYKTISRKHVGIQYNPSNQLYIVTDYSSNGTFISDESEKMRIEPQKPTWLAKGKIVNIGNGENSFKLV